ncbi:MAG: Gfo/Idh/MocA family oxidoreductase [Lentisphaerae bacterium]|nr:Gfo/Idh/MocA family oxidoreductase [Lentisphaerota bacterium]
MSAKVLRGGVFGFGGMGQEFTTRINFDRWYGDDVQIVGVCNRGADKRQLAEQRYGLKAFVDPSDLIKEGLDFAIVTSTTVAHVEHGCLLAAAGVPMLMEKPLALASAPAKKLVEAVDRAGIPTVVNFLYRYQPAFQMIHSLIQDGKIGAVMGLDTSIVRGYGMYADGTRHRAVVEPEESGGWIMHHACHMVDIACWFAGEVTEVSTVTRSTVPDKFSEEVLDGRLIFKNGALGHASDAVGGVPSRTVNIIGSHGGLSIVNGPGMDLVAIRLPKDRKTGPARMLDPRETHPYIDPINNLLESIRGKAKPFATIKDAYYSLPVTEAMRESARQNGATIKVQA